MKEILKQLGFNEYQRKTYLALTSIKKGKVGEIAKRSKVPTSKLYEILNKLADQGYISITLKKPLTYKANDPKPILKDKLNQQKDKINSLEKQIANINLKLPTTQKSSFEIVVGKANFYSKVKEAVANSNKSIIAIVKSWKLDQELKNLMVKFKEKDGKARFMGPITKDKKDFLEAWEKIGVKIKQLKPEETRFTVWDGKIITIGLKDPDNYISLWIENEYLGKILTDHFNSIWIKSKHINTNVPK